MTFAAIYTSSGESQFIPTYHPLHRTDWGNISHSCIPSSIWPPLPEYIGPLRAKVEEVTEREGWTKRPWIRCKRSIVSSGSRSERLRWEIVSAASSCVCFTLTETVVMTRVARKDYTFADGTRIPRGTTVSVNPTQAHHDPETYENQNRLKASASRKCGSSRIVRNVILLPSPQSSCLLDTGIMPVLDATSQLASSGSCSRTSFSTTT